MALAAVWALGGCASVRQTVQQALPNPNPYQLSSDAQEAYASGEEARAERLYLGMARAAPNDPEIWLRLGNLYVRANKPDAAAEAYLHALALNRNDARIWYNLGLVRLRQGWASLIEAHHLTEESDPLHADAGRAVDALAPLAATDITGGPGGGEPPAPLMQAVPVQPTMVDSATPPTPLDPSLVPAAPAAKPAKGRAK